MRPPNKACFLLVLCACLRICALAQVPTLDPTWIPVWSDEFSSTSLQTSKWCRIDHRKYGHNRPNLNAFRTDDNSNLIFGNGVLTQVVRRENTTAVTTNQNTGQLEPHTYRYSAPAWLISNQKFRYGYFEIRCKLPVLPATKTNRGIGANFWMFWHDENTLLEAGNEIDIFEFIQDSARSHIQTFNAHYRGSHDPLAYDENPDGNHLPSPDFTQFHTFACHWTPGFIKYYLDGNEIHRSFFYPDEMIPMRMVVDVNVFTSDKDTIDFSTLLPYHYDIDYVRVYKLNGVGHCTQDYAQCSPALLQPAVYRSVTLGGGNCVYSQPVGTSKYIWAANSITLYGDYTVPVGADLVLDNSPCYEQEVHHCNSTDCIICH